MNTEAAGQAAGAAVTADIRTRAACDGTPYREAFNEHAPPEVRGAAAAGTLLWSVPWRGPGRSYFELYDTSAGPVLKTDICIGWAYAWGWPDAAAAVRHVRRYTADLDLAEDYGRRRAAILIGGPWGIVIEQGPGNIRAILHTEHGPETRWYQTAGQALRAAAAYARDNPAWSDRLRGADPAARAAERAEVIAAAAAALADPGDTTAPAPERPAGPAGAVRWISQAVTWIMGRDRAAAVQGRRGTP